MIKDYKRIVVFKDIECNTAKIEIKIKDGRLFISGECAMKWLKKDLPEDIVATIDAICDEIEELEEDI